MAGVTTPASTTRAASAAAAFPYLSIAVFLIYLDATIVTVALPAVQAKTGASMTTLQWLSNGYTLALASLLPGAGASCDRFGRRRVLVVGLSGFLVASAACAFAPSFATLLVARVVQGVGAALIVPASLASLPACFPDPRERARAIGRMAAIASLATACGPVAGGWLVAHVGWSSIFGVGVPFAAIALAGVRANLPHDAAVARGGFDLRGQALLVATIVATLCALTEAPVYGPTSPVLVVAVAIAASCGFAFARHERATARPMWPATLLRRPAMRAAGLANLLGVLGFFVAQFVLAFWLQEVRHATPLESGARLLWLTVAMLVGSPLAGRWMASRGPRPVMVGGASACAFALAGLACIDHGLGDAGLSACLVVLGAGLAALAASGMGALLGAVPPAETGVAIGAASTLRHLGAAIGVAIAGSMLASTAASGLATGVAAAFAFAAACAAVVVVGAWRWLPRG